GENPWAAFQSNNVSPGLMINYKDPVSFKVNITGFEDLVFSSRFGEPTYTNQNIRVFFSTTDNKTVMYRTFWDGDGLYEFGYEQVVDKLYVSDFEVRSVAIQFLEYYTHSYQLGDNTTGTVEFIFPETEVPEPSSLLALAFGGAGTALAAYKRKQR
ncbi:MAG: PEP-CTERM sorting domain-containing protein, partial [Abditibacteriota bacterium]|nr:PEP-CTERM sorting domain-containing protein [Abditibacteriota bacterium]